MTAPTPRKTETLYATATGLYTIEDFFGPPPMPFEEVVKKSDYDADLAAHSDALKQAEKAILPIIAKFGSGLL